MLRKRLASGNYVIKKKIICGTPAAWTAYCSLFETHLRYGIAAWSGTNDLNMERVFLQLKEAVRNLAGIGYRDSCRKAFKEHNILTVSAYLLLVVLSNRPKLVTTTCIIPEMPQNSHFQYTTKVSEKKTNLNCLIVLNTRKDFKKLMKWLEDHPLYTEKEFLKWRKQSDNH